MSTTFHGSEVVDNLKKILDNTCKKISDGDRKKISGGEEISEYFCPCGYVQAEEQKDALTVRSAICGF